MQRGVGLVRGADRQNFVGVEETMQLAPMVASRGFSNECDAMANQQRLDSLQTQIQLLVEHVERLKIENQQLREQHEKSEWLAAEFRQIMLDRLRQAEGH